MNKFELKNSNQDGIAHVGLILLVVLVIAAVGFAAFRIGSAGKSKDNASNSNTPKGTGAVFQTGSSGCTPDAPVAVAENAFTESPLNLDQVKVITLGKETNDPRFVYPWINTDKSERTEIFAPATGKLYMIRHKVYEVGGEKGNDYDMFFAVDCKTVYRFNHISNPREDIKATYPAGDLPSGDYANGGQDIAERVKPKTAITVKAGESLGSTIGTPGAHSFDFAVGVAKDSISDKIAVCPFSVFSEPHKTKLLNMLGSKTDYKPRPGMACDVEAKKF